MVTDRVFRMVVATAVLLGLTASSRGEFITCGKTVWYRVHETPTDPVSDVVFIVRLKLKAEDSTVSSVGWRIEAAEFRQPNSGGSPDTVWHEILPPIGTSDGLWWCNHADVLDPQLGEFAMPPELKGVATAEEPSDPNLQYVVRGVPYTPPPEGPPHECTAGLDYAFTKVGTAVPEEEGDDEPVEESEGDSPPIAGPFRGNPADGLAIQSFVDGVFAGQVDIDETPCFIVALLGGDCGCPRSGLYDCNANGDVDELDIFLGISADCNGNGKPDECEIDSQSQAPGGPFYCTEGCDPDCNANGVPDACDPDCNRNGVPDDCDLAGGTSSDADVNGIPDECESDCNANGIPDAWDIARGSSADCNLNMMPDECEADCNGNGVPDDCDLDPTDPDGNGNVSEDCNQNGYPDECDLTLPLFPSLDCNDNMIPDECDIATCLSGDPSCQDCNVNGIPDGCDIDGGLSLDANANGIPDACEQQQMMGGDSPGGEASALFEADRTAAGTIEEAQSPEAAWEAFYEWSSSRVWGPPAGTCGSAQFQSTVEKLESLGLPVHYPFRWRTNG